MDDTTAVEQDATLATPRDEEVSSCGPSQQSPRLSFPLAPQPSFVSPYSYSSGGGSNTLESDDYCISSWPNTPSDNNSSSCCSSSDNSFDASDSADPDDQPHSSADHYSKKEDARRRRHRSRYRYSKRPRLQPPSVGKSDDTTQLPPSVEAIKMDSE